jgi:hypothetical protein
MNARRLSIILMLLIGTVVAGCTSVPLPKYAKVGDVVTVPLGGTKTVANSNYLTRDDVEVIVTDVLGQQFPVFVQTLYRVYADPSSSYALKTLDATSPLNNFVYANEGQWMLQFLMPSSNDLGQQPVPGLAQIAVTSTEINPDPDPTKRKINTDPQQFNSNLTSLPFEILPGTGSVTISEGYGSDFLTTAATVLATPDSEASLFNNVGGAVLVYQYINASFASNGIPYAVKNSPDQNIQLLTTREDMGDGTTRLTAMIISPNGFLDDASWVPGTSYYDGLYIALSWDNALFDNMIVTDANWTDHISLIAEESYYIDLNGNPISNVSPVLTKVR